jgi:hypothetical protein
MNGMSENQAKQQKIRELLTKLECEIHECRKILRGDVSL